MSKPFSLARPSRGRGDILLPIDTDAELRRIFGASLRQHVDLYRRSNAHRESHGPDCDVYPSSPSQAALWSFLVAVTRGRRFLEVGCGLGYTAALMAFAGGPRARVDTIEASPDHADLAERLLAKKGLANRIRVLRGRAAEVLPALRGPYDVVFLDGDWWEYPSYVSHLVHLTRPGSIVVTANLFTLFTEWGQEFGGKDHARRYLRAMVRHPRFRTYITRGEWHAYSVRV